MKFHNEIYPEKACENLSIKIDILGYFCIALHNYMYISWIGWLKPAKYCFRLLFPWDFVVWTKMRSFSEILSCRFLKSQSHGSTGTRQVQRQAGETEGKQRFPPFVVIQFRPTRGKKRCMKCHQKWTLKIPCTPGCSVGFTNYNQFSGIA